MKKLLILGGTGIMGGPLSRIAAQAGYQVDSVSLDEHRSDLANLRYIQTNDARSPEFLDEILKNRYDVIVDFMTYNSTTFRRTAPKFLDNCEQYFYLSSCRIFADEEVPVKETSPRLIDVIDEPKLLLSDDYAMHKARGENFLRAGKYNNWTIVRPSTTYGDNGCQLLSLSIPLVLQARDAGKTVLLHEQSRDIPASLTYGKDVADMIFCLIGKEQALGNDYNVTSNEYHTWGEIAEYYRDIFGITYDWVDEDTYLLFRKPDFDPVRDGWMRWQMKYGRLLHRIYDTSKMLRDTGLKQEQFLPLYDGLCRIKKALD